MGCKTVFALIFAVAAVLLQPASAVSVSIHGPSNSSSSLYIGNGSISFFVNSNSSKVGINTTSPNATLSVVGGSAGFGGDSVYDIVVNGTNYRVHEFTTVGTSTFVPPAGVTSVEYLVVAGGGAGGTYWAGGGGAGGLVNGTMVISSAVTITVGDKGVRSTSNYINGGSGGNSSIGAVVAIGGGGGGSQFVDSANNGGSGGGCGNPRTAGGATQPGSASGGYGNNGGNASGYGGTSGGGGGAGGAGSNAVSASVGGAGGAGLSNSITGVATYYAGGGGGIGYTGGAGGVGGSGIGGAGGTDTDGARNGASATGFGSGGGGGAGNGGYGGYGSPGIVILRYPVSGPAAIFQGSVILNGSASIGTSSSNAALQVAPTVLSVIGGSGGDGVFDIMDNGVAYRVHKFTTVGSSTFTPPVGVSSVEYLIVGGGGGGGTNNAGGGGGGGVLYGRKTMSAGSYPVVVGIGGANDTNGGNSYFGDLVAFGGGHGAYAGAADATSGASGGGGGGGTNDPYGRSGGSGGGTAGVYGSGYVAGSGTAGQGYAGGIGYGNGGQYDGSAGGGGGAGGPGTNGDSNHNGNGGPGIPSSINGTLVWYAGGGGGVTHASAYGGGLCGIGQDNYGGGGCGDYGTSAANGKNGVVIIRYPASMLGSVSGYSASTSLAVTSSTGRVGVGTANPLASLHVNGTSFFNGSVGIGTTVSSEMLHVAGLTGFGGDSIYDVVENGVAYRVHKFTTVGNSTFIPPVGVTGVQYLVVAGGGGGGGGYGGGGGAGGYLSGSLIVNGIKTITVGAGGSGAGWSGGATSGSDSVFDTIIAKGGGHGGEYSVDWTGQNGGSGGGGGARDSALGGSGIAGQGYAGGAAIVGAPGNNSGGGGGGSSHAGYVGYPSGGLGGAGTLSYISGSPVTYAVGGSGSAGGNGVSGINNTGSGGGGGGGVSEVGGNGGSGIVIIRYQMPAATLRVDGWSFFNGSVGIGTASPVAGLHVVNNKSLPYTGLEIQDSAEGLYRQIYLGYAGNLYFWNGANEGYLSSAGAWTSASDASYKKDVKEIRYGLADLMLMQPRSYRMKSDNSSQIGFVAQELEKVVPEVVSGEDGRKGIAYGQLSAVIVKAVQEQQAKIAAQDLSILDLTRQNQDLRSQVEQLREIVCAGHPDADACN